MPARIFKIPLNKKYKKIFDTIIIKELQKKFSEKDVSFKAVNGHFMSTLHAIDLELFSQTIKNLKKNYIILKNKNPLKDLEKQIKSVKSYGIKGKKRIYMGS